MLPFFLCNVSVYALIYYKVGKVLGEGNILRYSVIRFDFVAKSVKEKNWSYSLPQTAHSTRCECVVGGYPVTAWRTTCLYGVSDSRASPRLSDGVTSSVSDYRPHTLRGANVWWVAILSPHGALRAYTVFPIADCLDFLLFLRFKDE